MPVVGPSLAVADALATAIFGDGARSLSWMMRFPEDGALMVTAEGRVRWTEFLSDVIGDAADGPGIDLLSGDLK